MDNTILRRRITRKPLGSNPCNFAANETINTEHCASAASATCYNTGGITMNAPVFSANYNGMQAQLTRLAGRSSQFGLVYTWSKAMDDEDNGAGSGSAGTAFSYPAYFYLNRALASYDRKNNLQFWGIYNLPFGPGQRWVNHGVAGAILGGFQLNGQLSHVSGTPFSVSPSANTDQLSGQHLVRATWSSRTISWAGTTGPRGTPPFPAENRGSIQHRSPTRRSPNTQQTKSPSEIHVSGVRQYHPQRVPWSRVKPISTPAFSARSTSIRNPRSRFASRHSMCLITRF